MQSERVEPTGVFLGMTPIDVLSRTSELVGSANRLGLSPSQFRFILVSGSKSLSSESQSSIPREKLSFILFLVAADGGYWSFSSKLFVTTSAVLVAT